MANLSNAEWEKVLATNGMMVEADLRWLIKTAAGVPSWTEVGVYCGRSALAVGLALPPRSLLQLVEIDFRPGFYANIGWLLKARPGLVVTICETTSVEAAKVLPDTEVAFVDDDHTYEGVKASVAAWERKCRILCGHDHPRDRFYPPHAGVKQAVDEACSNIDPVPGSGLWLRTGPVEGE